MTNNNQKQPIAALQKNRLAYLDNLKAFTIILVVIIHTAVTYSGIGSWFYIENKTVDSASFYFFFFVESFNQAFFMSLFFLIAAYFVPSALDKKGAKQFILDRLFRLGTPTLIFIFLLFPFVVKMGNPDINLFEFYKNGLVSFSFISWTGPMWFALTLLIFSIIYVPFNSLFIKLANRYSFEINTKTVLGLTALITVIAFAVRLIYPIGTSVINLQFCFFSAYVFMFLMGIMAFRKNMIDNISYSTAKKWFIAAFALGFPLWILVVCFGVNKNGLQYSAMIGGWNFPAFGYALWESFFCVTIIIGLIGIFKKFFNEQNSLQKFLSTNAFGVYVFHPLILVATSVLLKNLHIYPILKFILVAAIAIPASFIFSALIRKIRIFQKVFS
jgi:surface polysaccharide O-acyltransferase-like enzyme